MKWSVKPSNSFDLRIHFVYNYNSKVYYYQMKTSMTEIFLYRMQQKLDFHKSEI